MNVTPTYIEDRALSLYEQIHATKFFQDEVVDSGTTYHRTMVVNPEPPSPQLGTDESLPSETMDYEEEDVRMRFLGAEYEMIHGFEPRTQSEAIDTFDTDFVHSFTDAIHHEITNNVSKQSFEYDTMNGVLIEATLSGRRAILEESYSEPDSMLVSDGVAEEIVDDSFFEEWDPIERDIEEEFGIDVYRDDFDTLYGNEILLADTDRLGVQFHARDLYAMDKHDRIVAGMKGGFKVLNEDVAVRLTI